MTALSGAPFWVEMAGYLACLLVFLSYSMKSLMPLRLIAIGSNLVFIAYGFGAQLVPILLLHSALLPINVLRMAEQLKMTRRVRETARENAKVETLIPFMHAVNHPAGSYLFQKGDPASTIYYLSKGTVQIPEIRKDLSEGTLFGEVGLFTPDRSRTASARCLTNCQLHVISDTDIEKICMQDPSFGLFLTKLIATRMAENQERTLLGPSRDDARFDHV